MVTDSRMMQALGMTARLFSWISCVMVQSLSPLVTTLSIWAVLLLWMYRAQYRQTVPLVHLPFSYPGISLYYQTVLLPLQASKFRDILIPFPKEPFIWMQMYPSEKFAFNISNHNTGFSFTVKNRCYCCVFCHFSLRITHVHRKSTCFLPLSAL